MVEKKLVGEKVVVVRPTEKVSVTAMLVALVIAVAALAVAAYAVTALWNVSVVSLSKGCCSEQQEQEELVDWRNDRYTVRSWNSSMVADYSQ